MPSVPPLPLQLDGRCSESLGSYQQGFYEHVVVQVNDVQLAS